MPEHADFCVTQITDELAEEIIGRHIDTVEGRRKLLESMHGQTIFPSRCPGCEDRSQRHWARILDAVSNDPMPDPERAEVTRLRELLARRAGAFGLLGVTQLD
jgi:hypothetical protein